jgi:hypothetical protein
MNSPCTKSMPQVAEPAFMEQATQPETSDAETAGIFVRTGEQVEAERVIASLQSEVTFQAHPDTPSMFLHIDPIPRNGQITPSISVHILRLGKPQLKSVFTLTCTNHGC